MWMLAKHVRGQRWQLPLISRNKDILLMNHIAAGLLSILGFGAGEINHGHQATLATG
jgi:hypothetical protein